jgi:predicted metal-dependent phosphotriesterase family hydrolase
MKTRREFLTQVAAAGALVATSPFAQAVAAADVVQTVLGPLAAAKLGFTLTHEHLGGWTPEFQAKWPKGSGESSWVHRKGGRQVPWQKRADNIKRLIDAGFAQH